MFTYAIAELTYERNAASVSSAESLRSMPCAVTDVVDPVTAVLCGRASVSASASYSGTYDVVLEVLSDTGQVEEHVDAEALLGALDVHQSEVVTPLMFEYGLLARARERRRRIVLPEGDDDRILQAAGRLLVEERPDRLEVGSKSTPTDVVTQMDRAAERLLVEWLTAARPDDGVLGE